MIYMKLFTVSLVMTVVFLAGCAQPQESVKTDLGGETTSEETTMTNGESESATEEEQKPAEPAKTKKQNQKRKSR